MIIPIKGGYAGNNFILRERMVNGMTILGTRPADPREQRKAVELVAMGERENKSLKFLEAFSRRQK